MCGDGPCPPGLLPLSNRPLPYVLALDADQSLLSGTISINYKSVAVKDKYTKF